MNFTLIKILVSDYLTKLSTVFRTSLIPPFLLLVAGDREISKTVNQNFYQQLIKNCYDATILYFEDKNHVSIDYDLGKENDNVFPMVLEWLNQHQQYE